MFRLTFPILSITLWAILTSLSAYAGAAVEVKIDGVSGELLDNVRAYLSIEQQKGEAELDTNRLQRLHKRATGEIHRALQPFGYYKVTVDATLVEENDKWVAHYRIELGPPARISAVDIQLSGEGRDDPEFQKLLATPPLKVGDILDHRQYENLKQSLQNLAAERGYFEFTLPLHEVRIDPAQENATVTLHADTGPRFHFGATKFDQDALRPELLARYPKFKQGDPYHADGLLDLQVALFDSDYFSSVEINPRRDEVVDDEVPVEVRLLPRPRHLYTAGAGFGTDSGPRLRLGWENRRINDRGHRMNADYRISAIRESLGARYRIPVRNPRTDEISFTTSWTDDHPETSDSETFLLGIGRTLGKRSGWLETTYLNYQTERFSVGEDSGQSELVLPGITYSKVRADNRSYPLHGWRLWTDLRGTHTGLGSDVQFLQWRGQGKWIQGIFDDSRLLLRGDVGTTLLNDVRDLPASVRFFAGGDQSVRGYDFNSLGPRDASGQVVGGENLLVGSIEYEYRFREKFSGAVFYDIGNALDNLQDPLERGAGFGLRWHSPIGPVRVDLAWALSEPGVPVRLHLNVGPDL